MDDRHVNTSEARRQALAIKSDAAKQGLKFFYTGQPCLNGHIANRRVKNGKCVECHTTYNREWNRNNPEKSKATARRKYRKDIEKSRESHRARYHKKRKENPEALKAAARKGYWNNIEKRRAKSRAESEKYRDKRRDRAREYYRENRAAYASHVANRRALKMKATPLWSDKTAIRAFYAEAKRLEKIYNMKFEVDHIIPLQGKNVCGLHVENNLQVIPRKANRSKANHFPDDAPLSSFSQASKHK